MKNYPLSYSIYPLADSDSEFSTAEDSATEEEKAPASKSPSSSSASSKSASSAPASSSGKARDSESSLVTKRKTITVKTLME